MWEANVGSFTAVRDGHHEVCYLLSGKVTVESDNGDVRELGAGDLFVMPSGWQGTWHIHEPVRKVFVVVPIPRRSSHTDRNQRGIRTPLPVQIRWAPRKRIYPVSPSARNSP